MRGEAEIALQLVIMAGWRYYDNSTPGLPRLIAKEEDCIMTVYAPDPWRMIEETYGV
jgi:hypothetical protein